MNDINPAEKRSWYDTLVNFLASLVLLGIWYLAAWGFVKMGWVISEERCFMFIVASSLALHMHKVRHDR